jgi:hypothetical protein
VLKLVDGELTIPSKTHSPETRIDGDPDGELPPSPRKDNTFAALNVLNRALPTYEPHCVQSNLGAAWSAANTCAGAQVKTLSYA